MTTAPVPLVLFSGLAADASLFAPQRLAFPQLIVPPWPVPIAGDTLESYCDRLADDLQSHRDPILGGASFGGIIALHVAKRLQPRAVVLIGSVRAPDELPRIARAGRPLKPLVPLIPVSLLQLVTAPLTTRIARRIAPHFAGLARQFYDCDRRVFKWSLARILDWSVAPQLDCPVLQIHGDCDRVMPIRYTHPDTIVAGGGHVLSLTHPAEVNNFLRAAIAKYGG
ncbi:hypothetical protein Psta_0633 [Pirellula staleyi DSM 6068]|uniref:AB hydrolase-1 domain-containing protein n=1 Tax=Pirellula staleyi (strain ATCC 27377 / DSM 6068 / ICPB 4128) TaxID=530564 RepID=D2R4H1_PIRSD|nr:alpha/beta hydrolase [Pirellula staleyi]ADB15319.1 hypothetical protein Psta_0633 [Pirellula staleyi DSM 6068]